MVQRCRSNFTREAQIWSCRVPDQRTLSSEFENLIRLSDEFYQEITSLTTMPIAGTLGKMRRRLLFEFIVCGSFPV